MLWAASDDGGNETGKDGAISALDPESALGAKAEKDQGIGRPRSLHASPESEAPGRVRRQAPRRSEFRSGVDPPAGVHPLIRVRQGARVPVHTRPGGEVAEVVRSRTEFGSPTVLGVVRATGQWLGVSTPVLANHRIGWIRHNARQVEVAWTERSIHINLSERRATLRERGRPRRSFTVTVGAPGTETPTGRFAVTDTFRGGLNPVYGCCAIALSAVQPNLPPSWPGGDRIAIHGNGTGQPLGIAASNGCLRAENQDVSALVDEVGLGTPVFIHQ